MKTNREFIHSFAKYFLAVMVALSMTSCAGFKKSGAEAKCSVDRVWEDWTMFKNGPEHVGFVPGSFQPPLKVKWKFPGKFVGFPTVADGVVYCGSADHKMYAFDMLTGKVKWTFLTKNEVEGAAAVVDNRLFFGSYDGFFYCVDKNTGKLFWKFKTGPAVDMIRKSYYKFATGQDSPPVVKDGIVYFGAFDGKLYALKVDDGKVVWTYQTKGGIHTASPALSNGRLYIGSTDGVLHCVNASDGKKIWTKNLSGSHVDHMASSPTIYDGVIYLGTDKSGNFYALDAATGDIKWNFRAKSLISGSPSIAYGKVYFFINHLRQSTIYALDLKTGKEVWSTFVQGGWGGCSPIVCDGLVWVTMRDAKIEGKPVSMVALDAQTGQITWSFSEGRVWGTPTIASDMLFFSSSPGGVFALEQAK